MHIETTKIHYSVLDRLEFAANAYAPINLPENYVVVDDNNHVINRKELKDNASRRFKQGELWNYVAKRKAIYGLNSVLVCIALCLGFMSRCDSPWAVPGLIVVVGIIAMMLTLGGRYKKKLKTKMLKVWQPKTQLAPPGVRTKSSHFLDNYIDDTSVLVRSLGNKIVDKFRTVLELFFAACLFFSPALLLLILFM